MLEHTSGVCQVIVLQSNNEKLLKAVDFSFFLQGFAIRVDLLFHWPMFASAANVVPRDSRADYHIKRLQEKAPAPRDSGVNCAQGKCDFIHQET